MSIGFEHVKAIPVNEAMFDVMGFCSMQIENQDVSIPVLAGDGGIGKTAQVHQMCQEVGWDLYDIHYGLKPIEEISGLPDFGQTMEIYGKEVKCTNWTLPDILGDIWALWNKNHKPVVILFDDYHLSSPANMALGYELFTEKKLRGYLFPPKCAFVLAMNISGAKSLANAIPAPIVNRLMIMPVVASFSAWKEQYAIKKRLNSKVLGFLSNAKHGQKFFQGEEQVNKPWPSARQWTRFANYLSKIEAISKNDEEGITQRRLTYLCAGHVGDEAASEFTTYYKLFSEVETTKIFDREIPIVIPGDMSKRYIYILANASECVDRYTKEGASSDKQLEALNIFSEICLEMGKVASEISVTGIREIIFTEAALGLRGFYATMRKQLATINNSIWEKIKDDIHTKI